MPPRNDCPLAAGGATCGTPAMRSPAAATHSRAVGLMVLSACCLASNILLVRFLDRLGFNNVWLVSCMRFLVGLAVVATVYRREWQPQNLFRHRKLVERGLVGGASIYVVYLAIVKAGAGRATFINNTYVVWGGLLAAWVLHEKLRRSVVVGCLVSLTGLALLTRILPFGARPSLYDGIALLSAFMAGYVVVTIRQLHATEHSSTIFAAQCAYGLVLCAVPALLHLSPISFVQFAVLIAMGLAAAAGQMAMTLSFRDLSVAEGSLLQMLTPLGVAIGSVAFFHEHFSPAELIGAALILGGTAFTTLRR